MKPRYRWSHHFGCWLRLTETCDPEQFPYWIVP